MTDSEGEIAEMKSDHVISRSVECLGCESIILLNGKPVGATIICRDCGIVYTIMSISPPALAKAIFDRSDGNDLL